MKRGFWVALIAFGIGADALAECAEQQSQTARSLNGKHQVTIHPDGRYKFDGMDGQARLNGHHWQIFVSNDGGRFMVADMYDGLTVFGKNGILVERYDGDDLCWRRTDAWACHPEGKWYRAAVLLPGEKIRFDVGFGPDVTLDLGKPVDPLTSNLASPPVLLARDPGPENFLKIGGLAAAFTLATALYLRHSKNRK